MEVRGFAVLCAFSTLVIGSGGCLLFTDSFNKPPQVKIDGPDAMFRGESKRYEATVMDDGAGAARFDWGLAPDCPASLADAAAARQANGFLGEARTLDLPRPDKAGPACVFVIVADPAGAQSFGVKKIDVKNRALVIHRPDRIERSKPAVFSAVFVTDPGGADDLEATRLGSFAWARDRACAEAEKAAHASMAGLLKANSSWTVDMAPRRPFCVSVVAKDENGIDASAALEISDIVNTGPAAAIRIVAPSPADNPLGLFTSVRLSGADPGDVQPEDGTDFVWTLTRPGGQIETMSGAEYGFSTETAGMYRVELVITEVGKVSTATPLLFAVEDTPPCIRETEPSYLSAPRFVNLYDQPRVFRVSKVADDADPVPAGLRPTMGVFVWSIRAVGGEVPEDFRVRAGSFRELTLPARLYQPGDRVEVRVEYLDRRDLVQARDLSRCKPNEPQCELVANSKCFQRITWTVDYL